MKVRSAVTRIVLFCLTTLCNKEFYYTDLKGNLLFFVITGYVYEVNVMCNYWKSRI